MSAYLLLLLAVVSRVVPHPAWLNFTAVGGGLLFFGARRPLWQLIFPVALLAGSDYYLTTFAYGYPFHLASYLVTWFWYAAIVALGAGMLKGQCLDGPRPRRLGAQRYLILSLEQLRGVDRLGDLSSLARWPCRLLSRRGAVLPQ